MGIYDNAANSYAEKILSAAQRDPTKDVRLSEAAKAASLRESPLRKTLQEIEGQIRGDHWKIQGRSLTPQEKTDLRGAIAEVLGIQSHLLEAVLRCSSNDNTMELLNYWDTFWVALRK